MCCYGIGAVGVVCRLASALPAFTGSSGTSLCGPTSAADVSGAAGLGAWTEMLC